jgi:type II secretory pathway component PulM
MTDDRGFTAEQMRVIVAMLEPLHRGIAKLEKQLGEIKKQLGEIEELASELETDIAKTRHVSKLRNVDISLYQRKTDTKRCK